MKRRNLQSTEDLVNYIREEATKGNIVFQSSLGLHTVSLQDFLSQGIYGILYDLNRDEATCYTNIQAGAEGWITNLACTFVIEELVKRCKIKDS